MYSSKLRNKFLKTRNEKSKRRFNHQRNFCIQKVQPQTCNFIKRETPTQVFSCEFYEISKKTLFYIIPLVAASAATTDLLKINNGNTRLITQICSKLRIKSPERRHWHHPGVFIVNFEIDYALNLFHTFFWCFHCWLWTSKCRLGYESYHIRIFLVHTCTKNIRELSSVTFLLVHIIQFLSFTETRVSLKNFIWKLYLTNNERIFSYGNCKLLKNKFGRSV